MTGFIKIMFWKLVFAVVLSFAILIGAIREAARLKNPLRFIKQAAEVTHRHYQNYCAKLEAMWG